MDVRNVYMPFVMRVEDAFDEAPGIRTLRLRFREERQAERFDFRPGQFALFSVFGEGECPFCIASPPAQNAPVECTFARMGKVTGALYEAEPGDVIGMRGPYGNGFPVEAWEGRDLVFVAGGIGLVPIRCALRHCLHTRERYGHVTLVYGARTVEMLVYKRELQEWAERSDVDLVTTVDPGGDTPEWDGKVGFVPAVLQETAPSSANAVAVVCGPPIMIKFALPVLGELGFPLDAMYTTLENRMKCGVGKCGRCNVGPLYVCRDGPVFTAAQLGGLPQEF